MSLDPDIESRLDELLGDGTMPTYKDIECQPIDVQSLQKIDVETDKILASLRSRLADERTL